MRIKQVLQTIVFLLLSFTLSAQEAAIIPGEILVQISPTTDIQAVAKQLQQIGGKNSRARVTRHVSRNVHIWKISFDQNSIVQADFLAAANANRSVLMAQNNHLLHKRTTPNDTNYGNQWQYENTGQGGCTAGADLDANLAWDVATGGMTSLGDTIVVAVIDDGIDETHLDFENIWKNSAEIPNNGIDDDNNGYIDDYMGWDVEANDDNIYDGGIHGVPVAGIVGAKGNNSQGVTGVNWNVKLMILQGGPPEDDAIASYDYVLSHRLLYNQTDGAQGAFVVSSNSSWGIDLAKAADHPLWCALYDTMGEAGILSCAATANANTNVDAEGDMPTSCSSEYLISVTNVDCDDLKVNSAGYGTTSIDLGAYGDGVYTTSNNNNYGGFGGTSGATPHVTGTVALLYSVPCIGLAEMAKAQPKNAARLVRDYILNGVKPNTSLANTVTGGHLNMNNSVQLAVNECPAQGQCYAPYAFNFTDIQLTQATLSWAATAASVSYTLRYRPLGGSWTTMAATGNSTILSNLSSCTTYEVQMESTCTSGNSAFSDSYTFTSDGCCTAPEISSIVAEAEAALVTWDGVTVANNYTLQIRQVGSWPFYTVENIEDNFFNILALQPCQEYEVRLLSTCGLSMTNYGPSTFFTTDCGACSDQNYCVSRGAEGVEEWIDTVQVGNYLNASGTDGGYYNFINASIPLSRGLAYDFRFVPGYATTAYTEFFKAWIDFNQDGDFDDSGEEIYTPASGTQVEVTGTFTVPNTALEGITRMRVSMQFSNAANACQTNIEFGEVEDYCVFIDFTLGQEEIPSISLNISPNPFDETLQVDFSLIEGGPVHYELMNVAGQQVRSGKLGRLGSGNHNATIGGLGGLSSGVYFIRFGTADGFVVRKVVKIN